MHSCLKPCEGQTVVKKSQGTSCLFLTGVLLLLLLSSWIWAKTGSGKFIFVGLSVCTTVGSVTAFLLFAYCLLACWCPLIFISHSHSLCLCSQLFSYVWWRHWIQYDWCPYKKRDIWTERETHRHTEKEVEAEIGAMYLWARGHQGLPATSRN